MGVRRRYIVAADGAALLVVRVQLPEHDVVHAYKSTVSITALPIISNKYAPVAYLSSGEIAA